MGDRREFLKSIAEAGAVFAGCCLGRGSLRAQSAARRREVVVGGRRVRTIDIHAHVVIPEATAIMGTVTPPDATTVMATVSQRFARMDDWGTDMQALSINGDELSATKFDPFWKKAEELGCLVFMHPQGIPELDKRLAGNGGLTNVIGNPLETTIFLSHLIFDGTLDRFPGLKICAAHAGGYLPSYAARSDYGCVRFAGDCQKIKKHPSEYLQQLYFDSMVFTPEGLRHLVAESGVSQIMIGTDYPFPWSTTTVDHVLKTPGLTDADRRAILGETAAKLLRIG